eukprot:TRINITY_DN5053_c0_g1_i1.p1 TRINITY_DN5053_c0_g1~~TRINITY_DN5053_c0_g1_i1.p1  ORF type:complete len:879 (+),score=183.82 TRINITY_DN5053_c0_g1_i1:47-2683(+)
MSHRRDRYHLLQQQQQLQTGAANPAAPLPPTQPDLYTNPVSSPAPLGAPMGATMGAPMGAPTTGPLGVAPGPAPLGPTPAGPVEKAATKLEANKLPNPTKGFTPADAEKVELINLQQYNAQDGPPVPRPQHDFIVNDAWNCSPRFMRSTLNYIPATQDIKNQSKIPMGLLVSPLAETVPEEVPVPTVDHGEAGPIRCNRCRAYINPFVMWNQSGTQYTCPFCSLTNDLPLHYQSPLISGQRQDLAVRPELYRGSVDFVATGTYQTKPPTPPVYVFLLDTSATAIQSGLVYAFASAMQRLVPAIFAESPVKLCFITYSSTVTFFNISPSAPRPQMAVMPDLEQGFPPLPFNAFAQTYADAKDNIEKLLQLIPSMYNKPDASSIGAGSALQLATKVLAQSKSVGKIFLFTSGLPEVGQGKLAKRIANAESDNEKTLFTAQIPFYKKLGEICAKSGVGLDLFACSSTFIDLATIGEMVKVTGGQCYLYPSFALQTHGEQLYRELFRNFTRESGYDGLLRLRTSTGLSQSGESGHFLSVNETDLMVGTVSADSAIYFELTHDEKLKEGEVLYFQSALLYTSREGQRKIRVHNWKAQATDSLQKVFKGSDLDTTLNALVRSSISDVPNNKMVDVRQKFMDRLAAILASYRTHCAKTQSIGQLILPESLRLLPVYSLGLLKTPLLGPLRQGTTYPVLPDARSYLMMLHNSMHPRDQAASIYPTLYQVHTMSGHPRFGLSCEGSPGLVFLPGTVRLSYESLHTQGIYLLDAVDRMYLWIGAEAPEELVDQLLLPEECTADAKKCLVLLTRKETDLSYRLFNLLSSRQFQRRLSPEILVIHQGSPLEYYLMLHLIEDGQGGTVRDVKDMDYPDFLRHLHRMIQRIN